MKKRIFSSLLAFYFGALPTAIAETAYPRLPQYPPESTALYEARQKEKSDLSRQTYLLDAALRLETADELRQTNGYYSMIVYCLQTRNCTGDYGKQTQEFQDALPLLIQTFRRSLALTHMGVYLTDYDKGRFLSQTQTVQLKQRPEYVFSDRAEREEIARVVDRDRFKIDYLYTNYVPKQANPLMFNQQKLQYTSMINVGAKRFYFEELKGITLQFPFLTYISHSQPTESEVIYAINQQISNTKEWIKKVLGNVEKTSWYDLSSDSKPVSLDFLLHYDFGVLKVSAKRPELIPLIEKLRTKAPPEQFSVAGWATGLYGMTALGMMGCFFISGIFDGIPAGACLMAGVILGSYGIYNSYQRYLQQSHALMAGMTDLSRMDLAYYDFWATLILTTLPVPAIARGFKGWFNTWIIPEMLQLKVATDNGVKVLASPTKLSLELARFLRSVARNHASRTVPIKMGFAGPVSAGALGVGEMQSYFGNRSGAQQRVEEAAHQPEIFVSYGDQVQASQEFLAFIDRDSN